MSSAEVHGSPGGAGRKSAVSGEALRGTKRPRIGYVPTSNSLQRPGDRRRFAHYAKKRNLEFEIADPDKSYDLVVVTQMADLSVWSRYDRGRIVYDAIDSYLAIPKTDPKGLLRGLAKFIAGHSRHLQLNFWKAIGDMCARADAVICSTEEQRRDIGRFSSNIHLILDIHTGVAQRTKRDFTLHRPIRLVWEGVPQTLPSLTQIRPAFERLRNTHPVELHVVTDPKFYRYLQAYGETDTLAYVRQMFPDAVLHEWREHTCADIITDCDIAVIPLDMTDPFARGKPENKLLLLWRMGMPVVTSRTPAYARAMARAGISATCADTAEWIAVLTSLIENDALRQDAGLNGKLYTEREFSEDKILAQWDRVFASVGFDFSMPAAQ